MPSDARNVTGGQGVAGSNPAVPTQRLGRPRRRCRRRAVCPRRDLPVSPVPRAPSRPGCYPYLLAPGHRLADRHQPHLRPPHHRRRAHLGRMVGDPAQRPGNGDPLRWADLAVRPGRPLRGTPRILAPRRGPRHPRARRLGTVAHRGTGTPRAGRSVRVVRFWFTPSGVTPRTGTR